MIHDSRIVNKDSREVSFFGGTTGELVSDVPYEDVGRIALSDLPGGEGWEIF
jgi:hypothetical protein